MDTVAKRSEPEFGISYYELETSLPVQIYKNIKKLLHATQFLKIIAVRDQL